MAQVVLETALVLAHITQAEIVDTVESTLVTRFFSLSNSYRINCEIFEFLTCVMNPALRPSSIVVCSSATRLYLVAADKCNPRG